MTTQDLTNNREFIIVTLIEKVGEENVKAVMQTMVRGLSSCDSLEELIGDAIAITEQVPSRRKESKLAAMVSAAHEDERYDVMQKEWVKY